MAIEFDSATSSYYYTAYTGSSAPREPLENPPSEIDDLEARREEERLQAAAELEDSQPATNVSDPALDLAQGQEPPPDAMLAPYDPAIGSLVDTVV